MSNKLKKKGKPAKLKAPFSNMQIQHLQGEFHATRQQLKDMEEAAYNDGWNDGEDWANCVNSICLYYALHELHGFGADRFLKVIKSANEYMNEANEGKRTIKGMLKEIEETTKIRFDDHYKELVEKVGL